MTQSVDNIKKDAETRMAKSVETLKTDLGKIRTGRAHPGLLEHVRVDYYGNKSPLSQVANVAVGDARTLTVTPWDKSMVPAIEKAIRESDLGLNPMTSGNVIRVPLPQLTEERRKELSKRRGKCQGGDPQCAPRRQSASEGITEEKADYRG